MALLPLNALSFILGLISQLSSARVFRLLPAHAFRVLRFSYCLTDVRGATTCSRWNTILLGACSIHRRRTRTYRCARWPEAQ